MRSVSYQSHKSALEYFEFFLTERPSMLSDADVKELEKLRDEYRNYLAQGGKS